MACEYMPQSFGHLVSQPFLLAKLRYTIEKLVAYGTCTAQPEVLLPPSVHRESQRPLPIVFILPRGLLREIVY